MNATNELLVGLTEISKETKCKVMLCEVWLYNFNILFVSTRFFDGSFKILLFRKEVLKILSQVFPLFQPNSNKL